MRGFGGNIFADILVKFPIILPNDRTIRPNSRGHWENIADSGFCNGRSKKSVGAALSNAMPFNDPDFIGEWEDMKYTMELKE